jgi:phosphopantothenoylcysteine decarboxylase
MDPSVPFSAERYRGDGKLHILLAASGSVATIKLPNIAEALGKHKNVSIRIILTNSAANFLDGQSSEQPPVDSLVNIDGVDALYRDQDEWMPTWKRGSHILHIELRKWCDVLLVAPCSANTLAKMAMGFADNLLLSVIRAWDTTGLIDIEFKPQKPTIFVATAMNTAMWRHPVTQKHLRILQDEWGADTSKETGWVTVLSPITKELMCGDVGDGAMMDWRDIVKTIETYLKL